MFEEGNFDDAFDDIDDMVNEAMENVKGDKVNVGGAVNTTTTGVSATSASVTTAGVSISTVKPRTPPTTTTTAFEDEDLTIAQTLVKIRNKGKGIIQEPEKPLKNPRKAQIQVDEELAMRLHKEEKVALERMQRDMVAQEEASTAALTTEFDDDDDSQKQAESSKKRPRAEHDEESVKKQKLKDDAKKEELRACLDIVLGDDIVINVESLATKYPIFDWKTHILTKNMMYYQIIRAGGSSNNYKIFSKILDDFDRQDVVDLYMLVKERAQLFRESEVPQPRSPTQTPAADEAASTGVDVRHGGDATTVSSIDA
ncbi:hypothetical protein Tco_0963459 [Tanacetum coccineum]